MIQRLARESMVHDERSQSIVKLEAVCLKAIEKQPRDRFSSMMEFRDSLKTLALRLGLNVSSAASEEV